MSEGPEIKLHSEFLNETLQNKKFIKFVPTKGPYVTAVDVRFSKFRSDTTALSNFSAASNHKLLIKRICSKGKLIYIEMQFYTLRSTTSKWIAGKYVYVVMQLSGGNWTTNECSNTTMELHVGTDAQTIDKLYLDDARQQCRIDIIDAEELEHRLNALGPDVLTPEFVLKQFISKSRRNSDKEIVNVLSNQSVCSGVGNVYRCEALYLAKIAPLRIISSLSDVELERIYTAVKFVTRRAYVCGGGEHYNPYVYAMNTDSARNSVASFSLCGRVIYWVPEIQQ